MTGIHSPTDHRPGFLNLAVMNGGSTAPPPLSGLTEILLRGVELAQDRRKTRYSRRRTAVENGLLPADALKVRRAPKVEETEAVDPALGDELVARLPWRCR